MNKLFIIISSLFLLVSCTNKYKADPYVELKCYSGGRLIYEGSTDKIKSRVRSTREFVFVERGTKKKMGVSGDCVVEYH